jgi:hypothetical protein
MDVWRKTKPKFLRNPGQSIDEQIDRLINATSMTSFYSSTWLHPRFG